MSKSYLLARRGAGAHRKPTLYGLPWNADDLDNLEIGDTGGPTVRKVGIRFRAPWTDTLASVSIAVAYGTGYSAGTGGSVKMALQADDGTTNHYPSGTDIASVTNTTTNLFPPTEENMVTWTFGTAQSVTKGTLYHLVFTQQDAAPATNWVSLDGTYNYPSNPGLGTQAQPWIDDTSFYCLRYDNPNTFGGATGWNPMPQVSASPINFHYTTNGDWGFSIDYTPTSSVRSIGGANDAVRMTFTPTSTQGPFTKAFARCYRQSATSHALTIMVKQGATLLTSGTVPAASFPAGTAGTDPGIGFWGSITFSPITFSASTQYSLELWSTSETTPYQAYPIRTAESGNFSDVATQNRFTDGSWQYTTNAGSTWTLESSDVGFKMQGYFQS